MKKLIVALIVSLFCGVAAAGTPVKTDSGGPVTTDGSGPVTTAE